MGAAPVHWDSRRCREAIEPPRAADDAKGWGRSAACPFDCIAGLLQGGGHQQILVFALDPDNPILDGAASAAFLFQPGRQLAELPDAADRAVLVTIFQPLFQSKPDEVRRFLRVNRLLYR